MAGPKLVDSVPPDGETNKAAEPKDTGPKPTKTLPTPRVGFAKQLMMLRGYAALFVDDKPVTTSAVAELAKLHPNTAVLANPFFIDVGFIQKAGIGYIPAAEVVQYHRAVAWNPETAPTKLASLLRKTWFARKLLPKLSLDSLSDRDAIEILADEAAAGPKYAGQIETLLEYLAVAGLIRRDGGQVRAAEGAIVEDTPMRPETQDARESDPPVREARTPTITTAFSHAPEGVLRFNVDVSVDMKEFATWRPERISAFWAGIAAVLAAKADVEGNTSR